ncbi:transposase [Haliscomenobacter hydrossis]|uniref:transposase n=1 Tax=Haliscomenobacter hydrossis TaxID=2350 RepID=UPI0026D005A6
MDGVGLNLILTLLSEVGLDLTQFPSAKHFTSWLCLCPNKKVSGGKVLSSSTRKNKSRLRKAFKQTAIGVCRKKDCVLAHFYRKMAAKHGKGTAITATARKIAVIVYHMLQKKRLINHNNWKIINKKYVLKKSSKFKEPFETSRFMSMNSFLPEPLLHYGAFGVKSSLASRGDLCAAPNSLVLGELLTLQSSFNRFPISLMNRRCFGSPITCLP